MSERFIDFAFSMKWLWVIVIFILWNIVNRLINAYEIKLNIERQHLTKDTEYDEEKIIGHINYIIQEALDQYIVLVLNPKNIYYINSKLEKEILNHLTNTVPDRLSPALISKLSLIYNQDYIPQFLGEHIYMIVTNYVLEFNLNQDPDRVAARQEAKNNNTNVLAE